MGQSQALPQSRCPGLGSGAYATHLSATKGLNFLCRLLLFFDFLLYCYGQFFELFKYPARTGATVQRFQI
jgi:hypothetical protein